MSAVSSVDGLTFALVLLEASHQVPCMVDTLVSLTDHREEGVK